MKKKILSIMLSFVMVTGVIPVMDARAEVTASGTCGDNLTWTLDTEGTLTISGEGEMDNYESWGSPWYDIGRSIVNVIIGSGVTSIGEYAFVNCDNLTSVQVVGSLEIIGKSAFENCSDLTSVQIPDSLKSIGDRAFYDCWSLTDLTIPDGVFNIGRYAFFECDSLVDVVIPGSVKSIKDSLFYGCDGLLRVTLEDGVETIERNVFDSCDKLETIIIPGTVTETMGFCAIYGCVKLNTVYYGGKNWYDIYDNKYKLHLDGCGTVSLKYFRNVTVLEPNGNIVGKIRKDLNSTLALSDVGLGEGQYTKLYIDKELTTEYSLDTPIKENLTLYVGGTSEVEMGILENSYFESADKTQFAIGFVTDKSICHTDFKTLKFGFTDSEGATYLGYSVDKLGLPVITSEDGAEILLGIVLNNIPIKYKDNVTLTLTNDTLK